MKQSALYKIVGMQKDVADSGMDKQHAYDLHNVMLRNTDSNTETAIVNEPGNIVAVRSDGNPSVIRGTVIGYTTLNDTGIIFTHESESYNYLTPSVVNDPMPAMAATPYSGGISESGQNMLRSGLHRISNQYLSLWGEQLTNPIQVDSSTNEEVDVTCVFSSIVMDLVFMYIDHDVVEQDSLGHIGWVKVIPPSSSPNSARIRREYGTYSDTAYIHNADGNAWSVTNPSSATYFNIMLNLPERELVDLTYTFQIQIHFYPREDPVDPITIDDFIYTVNIHIPHKPYPKLETIKYNVDLFHPIDETYGPYAANKSINVKAIDENMTDGSVYGCIDIREFFHSEYYDVQDVQTGSGYVLANGTITSSDGAKLQLRRGEDSDWAASSYIDTNDDVFNLNMGYIDHVPFLFKITPPLPALQDKTYTYKATVHMFSIPVEMMESPTELSDIDIIFNVFVPKVSGGGGGGVDPTNPDDPVLPPVIDPPSPFIVDKYDEETSQRQVDHIYLVTLNNKSEAVTGTTNGCHVNVFEYFRGDLGFDLEHPIESTVYFENDEVQKVYWVDGNHQMRYANIANRNKDGEGNDTCWRNNLMFDCVPKLHLQENVTVTRNSVGGTFPSGTVQFAITYLNKYGAESNIAWISPIYYSSPDDRGGAPDEICANSFTIRISRYEVNGRFDYIRLYHILRTTADGEADVRMVADISIQSDATYLDSDTEHENPIYPDIVFTDTNTTGENVDPNELLYLGGINVIPGTIEQKSNTLFLGNLENEYQYLRKVNFDTNLTFGKSSSGISFYNDIHGSAPADVHSGYYSHENQLKFSSNDITGFRRGEEYRFGFQAQDSTGHWSDVWWIGDKENTSAYPKYEGGKLQTVNASFTLSPTIVSILRNNGYRRVRPVVVYPEPWERNIYTDGLLNPTVYNVKDRFSNAPFAQSSWFIRPFSPIDLSTIAVGSTPVTDSNGNCLYDSEHENTLMPFPETSYFTGMLNTLGEMKFISIDSSSGGQYSTFYDFSNDGAWAEFRHNHPLGDCQQRNGEVQTMYNPRESEQHTKAVTGYTLTFPIVALADARDFTNNFADFFYVDQSILTLNSADIEFDTSLASVNYDDCLFRITGIIPISSFCSSYNITTNTPPNKFYTPENNSMSIPCGFYGTETVGATMDQYGIGWKSFISAPVWHDDLAFTTVASNGYSNEQQVPVGFAVYPWQCSGSLNNDSVGSRKEYPNDGDRSEQDKESKSNIGNNYISAELKSKTIANLHYSYKTHFVTSLSQSNVLSAKISAFINQENVTLTKITSPTNSNLGTLHYFGNVDKLITPITSAGFIDNTVMTSSNYPLSRLNGVPRMVSSLPYFVKQNYESANHAAFSYPYTQLRVHNVFMNDGLTVTPSYNLKEGSDRVMSTIPIRYNSCNHLVVALNYYSDNTQPFLSWVGASSVKTSAATDYYPFWKTNQAYAYKQITPFSDYLGEYDQSISAFPTVVDGVTTNTSSYTWTKFDGQMAGYLYMGQVYRNNVLNRFGGSSEEALEQNIWLPAGNSVYLDDPDWHEEDESTWEGVSLVWSVGDTYYQRYDALRTYPATEEQLNKVIDIVSFMTETHINIDGRYDKNRGLSNNNHCRSKNFNKLNYAYSQKDNFFSYHTLNIQKVNLSSFKSSFTWTLSKIAGALRDEWTHITLANTYNCDGNKGSLTKLVRLDNDLVAFQDLGVAQILFNETSQVTSNSGLPFELANSGKMQGLRYYASEIGCQNKWSISVLPNAIYWIDGITKDFCALSSGSIARISAAKRMSSWFKKRNDLSIIWNPLSYNGVYSVTDTTTGEVFMIFDDCCLCYDSTINEFSGFFDYMGTDAMFQLNGHVITAASYKNMTVREGTAINDYLWFHRANKQKYCSIYGKQYPSWVEIVCNSNNEMSDYGTDKVFDNVSWRADAWEYVNDGVSEWRYMPYLTFSTLSGYDDYQKFNIKFSPVNGTGLGSKPQLSAPNVMPVNLRKKFKVWHTTFPREMVYDYTKNEWETTRNRIRDTWCHIRLTLDDNISCYKHVLHDIQISYFIP